MKSKPTKKSLTFGDPIANFYDADGKRRANGILRLAAKAHRVVFRGCNRYLLNRGTRNG